MLQRYSYVSLLNRVPFSPPGLLEPRASFPSEFLVDSLYLPCAEPPSSIASSPFSPRGSTSHKVLIVATPHREPVEFHVPSGPAVTPPALDFRLALSGPAEFPPLSDPRHCALGTYRLRKRVANMACRPRLGKGWGMGSYHLLVAACCISPHDRWVPDSRNLSIVLIIGNIGRLGGP